MKMTLKFDWPALWEAVKEPLRWFALAVIPVLIAGFADVSYGWAGLVVVILRIIDGYLHEQAPKGEAGGIVRF
jgi:hypothetical protein